MAITVIQIKSFDPYEYYVPTRESFVGSIKVKLPPVHIKVKDFGPLLPDVHLGGDIDSLAFDIEGIDEPGLSRDELIEFLESAKGSFCQAWELYQERLDEAGPILGSLL